MACFLFLLAEEKVRLAKVVELFGVSFQWCREYSRRENVFAFEVTPKVHKTMHLPFIAVITNPGRNNNYAEESMVGSMTKVWKASKSGRYKRNVQLVTIMKRLLGVFMRLEGFV